MMSKPYKLETRVITRLIPVWMIAFVILFSACSPHREIYPKLNRLARQDKFAEAVKLVESKKESYGPRNAVLYNLDRGLLYHHAGNYKASNEAFEMAERRMDELFTKSISGEVGAFIANDNTLPYRGEDFEGVIVNIYRALNYIKLNDNDAALVEARKVDEKLSYINSKYDSGKRNIYQEDAFARMLMGILYEIGGSRDDVNDAYISNKKAVENYSSNYSQQYGANTPEMLKSNLLTTATFMGREELSNAKKKYPEYKVFPLAEKRRLGQLVFIHSAGRSPVKVESSITAQMFDGNIIRIVFPGYRRVGYSIRGSTIIIDGKDISRLNLGEPIGAIAIKSLANRKGRIAAKAIARATTKYLANRALQQSVRNRSTETRVLAFIAGNVAAVASEQADLRAWQTLPDKIMIGRVLVKPGAHSISVRLTDSGGNTVAIKELGEVEVKAGVTKFFLYNSNY